MFHHTRDLEAMFHHPRDQETMFHYPREQEAMFITYPGEGSAGLLCFEDKSGHSTSIYKYTC
jgi:hypothetical protein